MIQIGGIGATAAIIMQTVAANRGSRRHRTDTGPTVRRGLGQADLLGSSIVDADDIVRG